MRRLPLFLFVFLAAARLLFGAPVDEGFFKANDVIALVGGEDMVAAAEYGYLELLLTRALPNARLKFRCLAWEGDTVFEQRRDLNFPRWEEQLEKIGATVVLCQFGQMESLRGKEKAGEFITAYEKLIDRFAAGGKRRIALILPHPLAAQGRSAAFDEYERAIGNLSSTRAPFGVRPVFLSTRMHQRDGVHLSSQGHARFAADVAMRLSARSISGSSGGAAPDTEIRVPPMPDLPERGGPLKDVDEERLRQLIIAKNALWDRYWRVQNWAFLAGDRTTQASSRDHRDPTKRWFPAEREQFLPLIENKEKEIWALAAQLR